MKKFALLPISLAAAFALSACGDDSSSGPDPTPASSAALSSDATPASSSGTGPAQVSSSDATAPVSSSGITPASSSDMLPPESSAGEPVASTVEWEMGSTGLPDLGCVLEPLSFGGGQKVTCGGEFMGNLIDDPAETFDINAATYSSFVGISSILAAIQPTDKAVFLMRHGDRTASTDVDGILTGLGYEQAKSVGAKIAANAAFAAEPIVYWHSEVPRTLQTCMGIAFGRGEATLKHVALKELNGSWFEKDSERIKAIQDSIPGKSIYEVISKWTYTDVFSDGYYDLNTRAQQFIDEIIVGKIAKENRISIAISHDQMIYPLVVFATQRTLEMKFYEDKSWLNFLAGIAVIVKADGSTKVIPVRGLDSGVQ